MARNRIRRRAVGPIPTRADGEEGDAEQETLGDCQQNQVSSFLNFQPSTDCPPNYPKTSVCIFSDDYCRGEVINGFCIVHNESRFVQFHLNNEVYSKDLHVTPYATKPFPTPKCIFPILSLLGPTESHHFSISHPRAEVEESMRRLLEGITEILDSDDMVETMGAVITKLRLFTNAHHAWLTKNWQDISSKNVALHFTKNFQPDNKFARDMFSKAKLAAGSNAEESSCYAIVIPLNMFKNVIDIYNILLYMPAQVISHNKEVIFVEVPNVIILDGYIKYGFGYGCERPPNNKTSIHCRHTLTDTWLTDLKKHTPYKNVSPLQMAYCSNSEHNLLHVQPAVMRNNTLKVPTTLKVGEGSDWLRDFSSDII